MRNLESPARAELFKPDAMMAALNLVPGQVIGDIGAGTGYFTRRFARRVGPKGMVFAVDIEPTYLEELERRATLESLENISVVASVPDDSLLAEASCDLLFLHNVYTYLPDRVNYLRHLRTRLKPGGRIAVIGWRAELLDPAERPRRRSITTDRVTGELREAGYVVVEDIQMFRDRYFLIASPRD